MQALILAAGIGSRLAPLTNTQPKCFVEVNGIPILFKQIDNLYENGIRDITIVAGYKSDYLIGRINVKYSGVKVIVNGDYNETNNMYSAYMARGEMKENFIMMNADVFFDASVIASLCKHEAPNAIVTEIGRYLDESMKVKMEKQKIMAISKQISENEAYGVSIDIYKFSQNAGKAFFGCISHYIERKELNLWSEVALNDILLQVDFAACPLNGRWVEIDNNEDLLLAEKIFVK